MSVIQVYIGGTEISGVMVDRSKGGGISITKTISQRWEAHFAIWKNDGVFCPAIGQSVTIKEDTVKLFTGCIAELSWTRAEGSVHGLIFQVTCTDKAGRLDQRLIKPTLYPFTADFTETVLSIVSTWLDGEGITTEGVPEAVGNLLVDIPVNYDTVAAIFNKIATAQNMVWWIDEDFILNFSTQDNLPACPISISDTSGNWIDGSPVVNQSISDYRNIQYVVSDKRGTPSSPIPM